MPPERGDTKETLRVAFLGPQGTYSYQAAQRQFGRSAVEFIEKETIADVINAVPLETPVAVIPAENSIYGPVVETLDLLRSPEVGKDKLIAGEIILQVEHSLLAIRGTKLPDVKSVFSHEQALGQCSTFLNSSLPNASIIKTSSTAAAAEAITSGVLRHNSAAICSEACLDLHPDLMTLNKAIQNENNNFTRFWIIKQSHSDKSPDQTAGHALLRVTPISEHSPNLSQAMTELKLTVWSIDRRPSTNGIPFHDVYFLHVCKESANEEIGEQSSPWVEEVSSALERIRRVSWESTVLGIWYR